MLAFPVFTGGELGKMLTCKEMIMKLIKIYLEMSVASGFYTGCLTALAGSQWLERHLSY